MARKKKETAGRARAASENTIKPAAAEEKKHKMNVQGPPATKAAAADPNLRDASGRTALINACMDPSCKKEAVLSLLSGGADPNARDGDRKSALLHACANGNLEVVRTLWEKGASLSGFDKTGATPLMLAAKSGNAELVRFLVERKLNREAKDDAGRGVADYAAEAGDKSSAVLAALAT